MPAEMNKNFNKRANKTLSFSYLYSRRKRQRLQHSDMHLSQESKQREHRHSRVARRKARGAQHNAGSRVDRIRLAVFVVGAAQLLTSLITLTLTLSSISFVSHAAGDDADQVISDAITMAVAVAVAVAVMVYVMERHQ